MKVSPVTHHYPQPKVSSISHHSPPHRVSPISHHSMPPLPEGLSEYLYNTINPNTGYCILHPKVKMCEYDEKKKRWIFHRKVCKKCGALSSIGQDHFVRGHSVKVPTRGGSCKDLDSSDRGNGKAMPRTGKVRKSFNGWLRLE